MAEALATLPDVPVTAVALNGKADTVTGTGFAGEFVMKELSARTVATASATIKTAISFLIGVLFILAEDILGRVSRV